MRSPRWLRLVVVAALVAGVSSFACGGGGGGGEGASVDLADIPTATLPNPLPEPIIIGEAQAPADGSSYTVQAGDTLAAIAERFGTTVEALLAANAGVDPTQLEVGQVLAIPDGSEQEVLPATVAPTPRRSGETTYTVQPNDNASEIAARFGVTLEELIAANNTTLEDIRDLEVGEVLVIPAPSGTPAP